MANYQHLDMHLLTLKRESVWATYTFVVGYYCNVLTFMIAQVGALDEAFEGGLFFQVPIRPLHHHLYCHLMQHVVALVTLTFTWSMILYKGNNARGWHHTSDFPKYPTLRIDILQGPEKEKERWTWKRWLIQYIPCWDGNTKWCKGASWSMEPENAFYEKWEYMALL